MNVKLVSREMIKPSTPTPSHLRNYNICLLDQFSQPHYTSDVFLYPPNNLGTSSSKTSLVLKESLSEMLKLFYPLAGRLVKEENIVRCNDEGVEYSEAQVLENLTVSELTSQTDFMDRVGVLCPRKYGDYFDPDKVNVLLAVQVSFFECGGFAVGLSTFHKVADGCTIASFLRCWASISSLLLHRQGDYDDDDHKQKISDQTLYHLPTLNAADIFPPIPSSLLSTTPQQEISKKKLNEAHQRVEEGYTMRRFIFSNKAIATLKARGTSPDSKIVPTRQEAVTALLWQCLIDTLQYEEKKEAAAVLKKSLIVHSVNVRRRIVPPLPDTLFGSIVKTSVAAFQVGDDQNQCSDDQNQLYQTLVKKLRESTGRVDDGYVRSRDLEGLEIFGVLLHKPFTQIFLGPGEKRACAVASYLGFPFYEIDFGWGNPIWVGTCTIPGQLIMLFDRTASKEVEALVCLKVDTMTRFEENPNLIAFCSTPTHAGSTLLDDDDGIPLFDAESLDSMDPPLRV